MRHPYLLDQLVRARAEEAPESVALRTSAGVLTYGELDAAADRVAAALAGLGVELGDRVGVLAEKSLETVATLYGIMRAGGVFVPVDAKAPAVRAATITRDAAVAAVVGDAGRLTQLLAEGGAEAAPRGIVLPGRTKGKGAEPGDTTLRAFEAWDAVLDGGDAPPGRAVTETDLAYVLYTSGSTGRPKGVMVSHANSLAFVRWAADCVDLGPDDVVSQHAPLHFDLSTFDLYASALCGSTVSIVPDMAALFPVKLADWARSEAVSVWYSVPSALVLLVRYGNLEQHPLDSLRAVVFAGEVFAPKYLNSLMAALPAARFWNWYGPTETNVCTSFEVVEAPPPDGRPVPIGAACGSCRGVVVDADGRELRGPGAEGELWVTGGTVAQGYWGDPAKTAQAFVAPATYRTGDIVEVLDGSERPAYRFLGRRDHMVKTRGYRVELGEVEAAMHAHPGVAEAVAVAVPHDTFGHVIVAFCTMLDGEAEAPAVEKAMKERLPAYMVPERVEVLGQLPKTANGKADRQALAARAAGAAPAE